MKDEKDSFLSHTSWIRGRSCPGRGKWRACRYYSTDRYTEVNRSHRSRYMGEGSVVNKTYEFFGIYW
jgi:hypothetical protein